MLLIKGMVVQIWVVINSSCCWFHTNIVLSNNEDIWFPYGNISMAEFTFYLYYGVIKFQHLSLEEKHVFSMVSLTKIKSQATFATKISLIVLDKSHETLVANDKGYWMK